MKKTLITLLCTCLILSVTTLGFGQADFEGEITYKVEFGQLPNQPGMENYLPKEMKNSIKGDKTRIDQSFGTSGNSQTIVTDFTNMIGFIASNMMGQKMLITISEEEMKASIEKYKNSTVTYENEYKEILGYKCQKAILETEGIKTTLYFTEQLPNRASRQFMLIKGMPLQYTTSQQGMEIKMTAISIEKKSIDASIFTKPSGYQEVSLNDLKKMGMGDFKF